MRALRDWLEAAGITSGPVFRSVTRHGAVGDSLSTAAVAQVVKAHAKRAGFDPSEFSGHSLRAGFVTSAAEKGATADRIMETTQATASSRWCASTPGVLMPSPTTLARGCCKREHAA